MKATWSQVRIRARGKARMLALLALAFVGSGTVGYAALGAKGNDGTVHAQPDTLGPTAKAEWPPYPPGEGPGRGPALVDPPGPDVTPVPGATPDVSQPWWYVPYLNAERLKGPFEGTVGPFRVQVAPFDVAQGCKDIELKPPSASQGTPLEISPDYLPPGRVATGNVDRIAANSVAVVCDGQLISVERTFEIEVPEGSGGSSQGLSVSVLRYRGERVVSAHMSAERWSVGEIAGELAALGSPVVGTVGQSAVLVAQGEYVTRVFGQGLSLEELRRVAEGIVK